MLTVLLGHLISFPTHPLIHLSTNLYKTHSSMIKSEFLSIIITFYNQTIYVRFCALCPAQTLMKSIWIHLSSKGTVKSFIYSMD